jgi:hypothetical protein
VGGGWLVAWLHGCYYAQAFTSQHNILRISPYLIERLHS